MYANYNVLRQLFDSIVERRKKQQHQYRLTIYNDVPFKMDNKRTTILHILLYGYALLTHNKKKHLHTNSLCRNDTQTINYRIGNTLIQFSGTCPIFCFVFVIFISSFRVCFPFWIWPMQFWYNNKIGLQKCCVCIFFSSIIWNLVFYSIDGVDLFPDFKYISIKIEIKLDQFYIFHWVV